MSTVDQFLSVGDYKGESVDEAHKDKIEVLSWGWGCSQSGTTHMGEGAGAGKVQVQDLTVTKFVDTATPGLILACCKGTHIDECVLTVRKAGDNPLEYLTITMNDCIICSVDTGGSGGDGKVTENVGINFATVKVSYVPQKKDGSGGAAVEMGWKIAQNVEA